MKKLNENKIKSNFDHLQLLIDNSDKYKLIRNLITN